MASKLDGFQSAKIAIISLKRDILHKNYYSNCDILQFFTI